MFCVLKKLERTQRRVKAERRPEKQAFRSSDHTCDSLPLRGIPAQNHWPLQPFYRHRMKSYLPVHYRPLRPLGSVRWRLGMTVLGLVSGTLFCTAAGHAQVLKDPLVPAGRARLDFSSSYSSWDSRFGVNASGENVEESLGDDLSDPTGASLFPGIEELESQLRSLATDAGFSRSIGAALGEIKKDVTRIDLSLELGIFDWLTVGATVPWVQNRTTLDFAFTPDQAPELGVNPAITSGSQVGLALQRLADAATNARSWANAACQAGAPNCQSAGALADRAEAFLAGSQGAYSASPFFPTVGSTAATALAAALTSLDADLSAAGLASTGVTLPFATALVDAETLAGIVTEPGSGYAASPLADVESLWELGDVEVHAAVRLLQGEVRDSGTATPRFSYLLVGGGLARLGTGLVDDADVFLDMSSGDGQVDLEASLFGALRIGESLAFRAALRYGIQQTDSLIMRVAPHEVVLVPLASKRLVRWTPGSYFAISASPRWHMTDQLSLSADYRYFSKGADGYEIIGDAAIGGIPVDPSDLEHESSVTLQEAGLGLTYSTMQTWREGLTGSPLEFNARLIYAVAGRGGRTPKTTRLELGFRIFRRIWGSN